MKIFVLSKDTLILYSVVALLLFGVVTVGSHYGGDILTSAPSGRQLPIYNVATEEKKVAITFDAAWGNEDTQQLLDILKENDARASFFMVGGWIDRFPDSVKAFADAGHEILNHSDSHAHFNELSPEEIKQDLDACETKISSVLGESKHLFRAPYGEYNDRVISTAKEAGYTTIQWDVDSLDWKDLSAQDIAHRVLSRVKEGSICLFHNGAKNTPEALKIILPELKKKGYTLVPVSELIYQDSYVIDNAGMQHPAN